MVWGLLLIFIRSPGTEDNVTTHDVCEHTSFGRALFYSFTMPVSADEHTDIKLLILHMGEVF